MINEVHSFSLSKGARESRGGHLLCPLFTPMCETDSYLRGSECEGCRDALLGFRTEC